MTHKVTPSNSYFTSIKLSELNLQKDTSDIICKLELDKEEGILKINLNKQIFEVKNDFYKAENLHPAISSNNEAFKFVLS